MYPLIEMILGILVAGLLMNTAINYDSLSNVNKFYTQQDLQILSETLLSAPGSVTYTYPLKANYEVSIDKTVDVTHNSNILKTFDKYNLIFTKEDNKLGVKIG